MNAGLSNLSRFYSTLPEEEEPSVWGSPLFADIAEKAGFFA